MISRRSFLSSATATAAYVAIAGRPAVAQPLGLPLGIQLYSVRQQLTQDYEGTLAQLSSLGYREVEAAGFNKRSAADVKLAMQKANLRCVSSHVPFGELHQHFDDHLAYSKELGVEFLICSSPGMKTPSEGPNTTRRSLTLDDWRYNAEQFNIMGEKANAAGIRFGYHNHFHEFIAVDGVVPYMEILRITDPAKVTLELDCGWTVVGGFKPVEVLRDHPNRFSMLHVKDFKVPAGTTAGPDSPEPTVTELGLGSIDYRPILQQAAKTQKIKHMFVEQEAFDMPYMQSLKVDADYIQNLKV
ncbi:sugar phosphate isomerase/epimerase family protein [Granulicella arctica]|uniref:sugar phosphate isomerase/epimerase family protein n=1 Tax=Granulicella arctica TaxID=940613 RepID=UPI0021E0871C|nr:sugar phosphate isomerase/epimerase [Granulicella arctica]